MTTLRSRGVRVVDPDEGYLACGMTGAGRLAGIEAIARTVCEVLGIRHDLGGETLLVTAGPTCEDLDPVRFLDESLVGQNGLLASCRGAAARRPRDSRERTDGFGRARGRRLGSGAHDGGNAECRDRARRGSQHHHQGGCCFRLSARRAAEAENEAGRRASHARARAYAGHFGGAGAEKGSRILVGFAAETQRIAESAKSKLARKGADIIVANDVTQEGAGFDADTNIVTLFLRDGREIPLPKMTKAEVADRILDQALELRLRNK